MDVSEWRVTTGPRSFDLERFKGIDRHGADVWDKVAYARTKDDLRRIAISKGVSADVVSGLPRYHPNAYRALASFTEPRAGLSEERMAKMQEGQAAQEGGSRQRPRGSGRRVRCESLGATG